MITSINKLDADLQEQVRKVIKAAKHDRQRCSNYPFNDQPSVEVYAYPQGDEVCWGVNGGENGFCFARGIE